MFARSAKTSQAGQAFDTIKGKTGSPFPFWDYGLPHDNKIYWFGSNRSQDWDNRLSGRRYISRCHTTAHHQLELELNLFIRIYQLSIHLLPIFSKMDRFIAIILHESREVTVREIGNEGNPRDLNIKVLKKSVDEFGETGGVIGTKGTFPQKAFTNLMRINWTKLFFSMLGMSEVPEGMEVSSRPDDDVGIRNESRFTTTTFSETGEMN